LPPSPSATLSHGNRSYVIYKSEKYQSSGFLLMAGAERALLVQGA
jgi:hypothetical protein